MKLEIKNNKAVIDLNKWQTQKEAAKNYISKDGKRIGCTQEYICKLIVKEQIDFLEIEPLGLKLVSKTFNG